MIRILIDLFKDITLYGLEKIGLYYSQYRGWVYDTADPLGLGRIKVSVPEVYGDAIPDVWAWPTSNYSGPGYGIQWLPRKNDLIWVSFEKGNLRKPMWAYGHFTKDQPPTELQGDKKYWVRTPSGLTILINDIDKTVTIFEKEKEIQTMVLGNTLQTKIEELITILTSAKVNTQIGPQGFLPPFITQLNQLKSSLPEIQSQNLKLS